MFSVHRKIKLLIPQQVEVYTLSPRGALHHMAADSVRWGIACGPVSKQNYTGREVRTVSDTVLNLTSPTEFKLLNMSSGLPAVLR